MATPHEDIKPPTLEFVYRLEFQVGDAVIVPFGPKGSRYIFPILAGGTFEGADPDFHGTTAVPSADFAVGHSDGSGVTLKVSGQRNGGDYEAMKITAHCVQTLSLLYHTLINATTQVNIILTTHDGAKILGIAEGRSKRDPDNPVNAELQMAKTFETGDDRYRWMNNEVFSEYKIF